MSDVFRSVARVLSRRFSLEARDDRTEFEFDVAGRTISILPNPKDARLVLVEAAFSSAEDRRRLEGDAALAVIHRLNGEAMAVQDWRFVLDEDGAPVLRANFEESDFEDPNAVDLLIEGAVRFSDVVMAAADIASAKAKEEAVFSPADFGYLRG